MDSDRKSVLFPINELFRHEGKCAHAQIDWVANDVPMIYMHGPKTSQYNRDAVIILHSPLESENRGHFPKNHTIVPLTPCSICSSPQPSSNDSSIWKRIHIKYLSKSDELRLFAANIHTLKENNLGLLVVDSFDRFFSADENLNEKYFTAAILYETAAYLYQDDASSTMEKMPSGQVFITDRTDHFTKSVRDCFRRWMPLMLCICCKLMHSQDLAKLIILTNRTIDRESNDEFQISEEIERTPGQIDKSKYPWDQEERYFPENFKIVYIFSKKQLKVKQIST